MENSNKKSIFKKQWVQSLTGIIIVVTVVVSLLIYKDISSRISIENSMINAPVVSIKPSVSGVLDSVYVKEGQKVKSGQELAHVGTEILISKIDGVIIYVNNTPGQLFSPNEAIVKMIDPKEFRVIGAVKETEGLSKINIGDPVLFTVDAFGNEKYEGVVDEISPTSKDSSVVFNISDKRETKEFDIKVKYDTSVYDYFRNGMSAKMKVYYK